MTAERLRTLIEGALAVWQADVPISFDAASRGCDIGQDGSVAHVEYRETGIGGVWRIEVRGQMPRVHRSVVPALATLRDAVCPERPRGRALFVPPPADGT